MIPAGVMASARQAPASAWPPAVTSMGQVTNGDIITPPSANGSFVVCFTRATSLQGSLTSVTLGGEPLYFTEGQDNNPRAGASMAFGAAVEGVLEWTAGWRAHVFHVDFPALVAPGQYRAAPVPADGIYSALIPYAEVGQLVFASQGVYLEGDNSYFDSPLTTIRLNDGESSAHIVGYGVVDAEPFSVTGVITPPQTNPAYTGLCVATFAPFVAGADVWDEFTQTTATHPGLPAATPSGHGWKQSASGIISSTSNQAYFYSGTAPEARTDYGVADMQVSALYSALGTWGPTLKARMNADGSGGYEVVKQSSTKVKISGYGNVFDVVAGDKVGLRAVDGVGVTTVQLLINDAVKVTWADTTFRHAGTWGGFGTAADAATRVDNFKIEAPKPADLLFYDDFACGVEHNDLAHYQAGHTEVGRYTGASYQVSGSTGLLYTASSGYNIETWIAYGEADLRVTAQLVGLPSIVDASRAIGFALRSAGVGDFPKVGGVGVTFTQNSLRIENAVDSILVESTTSFTAADPANFEVELELIGNQLVTKIDGSIISTCTLPVEIQTGTALGCWTRRGTYNGSIGYDYVKVEIL